MMKTNQLKWKTNDGVDIFGVNWQPNETPKAVLCITHGMGEHIMRYEPIAVYFTSNGYAVMGYDHRGHGQSGGQRGHFPSFDEFLNDYGIFLQQVEEQYGEIPKYCYGHSMGGNVLANYFIRRKAEAHALIFSSPYIKLAFQPPSIKVGLGKLMKNIVPTLSLPTGLEVEAISRDETVVKDYIKDKLNHDKVSSIMGIEMIETGQYALDHANEIALPTLIFHGSADRLTSFEASKEFASKIKNATFIPYEGLYHETHHEPEKATVLKNMLDWCNQQI